MNCPSQDELAAYEAYETAGSGVGMAGMAGHIRDCADCGLRLLELKRRRAAVVGLLASWRPERQPDCPDWESLAAYLESRSESSGRIEDHLERCEYCLLQVAQFRLAGAAVARTLPVLSSALPARTEKTTWLDGLRNNPWILAPVGGLVAVAIVAMIAHRSPKEVTMALSRPPTTSAPGPGSVSQPPFAGPEMLPVRPGQVGTTKGVGSPQSPLQPEGFLDRDLPRVNGPMSFMFRYLSGNVSHEIQIPTTEAPTLHSNDHFSFRVGVKSSMWLYAFQEDAHNAVSALFPNEQFNTGVNPVNPPKDRVIPAPGQDFALEETTGVERIYIFYGSARIDRCERLLSLVGSHSVDSDVRQILRELVRTADAGDPSKVGYSAMRFSFHHEP